MRTCWIIVALLACANAVTRDQFYPHGHGLDQQLPKGQDVPSPEIPLKVPILFYGIEYESIYVNNYGVLSFRADFSQFLNAEFPLPYPSIAGFYTNIDTTEVGAVYYRETDEPHALLKAEESVQNNFHEYFDFKPKSVFIATWVDVASTGHPDKKNSFQVAVISNGTESFVELLYPEREIQWIQKEPLPGSLPDAKAQVGFVAEDGRLFTLRGSGSHKIRNIVAWSNSQEPGKYVFRVGNISPDGNIVTPDLYNENDIEDEEESKNCAQSGPSVCHLQAKCVDYPGGICCQCTSGFYGNGKSCIRSDVPLRVHGKLNGNINDVSLDNVDVQAYVVVADGRSYTALSQGPPSIGSSLQLVNILGSVVGWLFAKPSSTSKNGYQLTGAVFNHTAEIFFPETGDRVAINQEYLGHDVFDQIILESDIRGTVPVILHGTKLDVSEYQEQYTLVENGLIRSETSRTFTDKLTGQQYLERITQTITYNHCRFAPISSEDSIPSTLTVSKNYLGYEVKDNIVRYGMSNKIAPLGQEDPCIKGRSTCGPYSTCVASDGSFKCVCERGYTEIYLENSPACVDIDECAAGTHTCDTNAECNNHDGGFDCRCRPGFNGNGYSCILVSSCNDKICGPNARCIDIPNGEPTCECNPGFSLIDQNCYPSGVDCKSCSPYASCIFDDYTSGYRCQCNPGFTGDGLYCVREYLPPALTSLQPVEQSTYSTPQTSESEYNETFVLPYCEGNSCTCPTGYVSYRDVNVDHELCRLEDLRPQYPSSETNYETQSTPTEANDSTFQRCDADTNCPPNAYCSYSQSDPFGSGHCVCPEGYEGDGYECIERSDRTCNCGPNAHCLETALICVCDAGYRGDGYTCTSTLSCFNNSNCETNAECRQAPNSDEYVCQCNEGYIRDNNDACILDQLCNNYVCVEHASCLYDENDRVQYCQCDVGYVGNGIESCIHQEETCEVVNNCHPDAICTLIDNTFSYQCVCNEGYIGNGYSCVPEANCRNNPYMCDSHASCLKRDGNFVCECSSGYNGNGSYCVLNPRLSGNFLVIADGASIYKAPYKITPRDFAMPINSGISQVAVGVAVDCITGKLYWGDVVENTIKTAYYDGSGFELFLSSGVISPEGLSVDWSARNIFWTDSKTRSISVANLDTKVRKVLFSGNGIANPRGIVAHPRRGKIFWSDWNRSNPKIEWANMDGTQRGIFLEKPDLKLPNSLAIDWLRDRLCFTDAGLQKISCVGIDDKIIEPVVTNCPYPFGLAITGDKFYWTDWKTMLESMDTVTGVKEILPIATGSKRFFGIAVAHNECPNSSNVCEYRNGNCEVDQLCLPDGRGGRTCLKGDQ